MVITLISSLIYISIGILIARYADSVVKLETIGSADTVYVFSIILWPIIFARIVWYSFVHLLSLTRKKR